MSGVDTIGRLSPEQLASASSPPRSAHAGAFRGVLDAAMGRAPDRQDTLRDAATRLVSTTFVAPVLASLRNSPFNEGGPFAPGTGEKQFGPLLDQVLTDRVTSAANFPLVDAVTRQLGRVAAEADHRLPPRPAADIPEAYHAASRVRPPGGFA